MTGPGRSGREDSEFRRFHYPETETLINLLGIRDPKRLEVAERRFVRIRLREGLPRAADSRTCPGFMAIHHHLFQDVYGWAGQERTYTTGRGPAPFATPENIRPWMEKQFVALREQDFLRHLSIRAFAEGAAAIVNEINAAHPFIEGNGRTQRTWLRALAAQAGYRLTFRSSDKAAWYEASRIGFECVDHGPMAALLERAITRFPR
jgi:fido (protein-threonine AMPylation protein)